MTFLSPAGGDSFRIELVLAHYSEACDWVQRYVNRTGIEVTIYTKGEEFPTAPGASVLPLPNVGRESHSYLYHIVQNYHRLANWTVFTEDKEPSWGYFTGNSSNGHLNDNVTFDDYLDPEGHDSMFVITAASQFPSGFQATRLGMVTRGLPHEGKDVCPRLGEDGWTDWWFTPNHVHMGNKRAISMLDFYHTYIALDTNDGRPLTLQYAQGARFAVSRDRIHARPWAYYTRLLMTLSRASRPQEGYWMETVWYDVFYPEYLQSNHSICPLPEVNSTLVLGPDVLALIQQEVLNSAVFRGSAVLTVKHADIFMSDPHVLLGLQKVLATKVNVIDFAVAVIFSGIDARLAQRHDGRRAVKVEYFIENDKYKYRYWSKGASAALGKATFLEKLTRINTSELALEISRQIRAAAGNPSRDVSDEYAVEVESFGMPEEVRTEPTQEDDTSSGLRLFGDRGGVESFAADELSAALLAVVAVLILCCSLRKRGTGLMTLLCNSLGLGVLSRPIRRVHTSNGLP